MRCSPPIPKKFRNRPGSVQRETDGSWSTSKGRRPSFPSLVGRRKNDGENAIRPPYSKIIGHRNAGYKEEKRLRTHMPCKWDAESFDLGPTSQVFDLETLVNGFRIRVAKAKSLIFCRGEGRAGAS